MIEAIDDRGHRHHHHVRPVEPDEGHADILEIVDQRPFVEAHHQHTEHDAQRAAGAGGDDRLDDHHADDLAAPRADRLEQTKLAAPFRDDGREQNAHHEGSAGEHQHHQREDAVEQRRRVPGGCRSWSNRR